MEFVFSHLMGVKTLGHSVITTGVINEVGTISTIKLLEKDTQINQHKLTRKFYAVAISCNVVSRKTYDSP